MRKSSPGRVSPPVGLDLWRSTACGGGHQACRPRVEPRSLTLPPPALSRHGRAAATRPAPCGRRASQARRPGAHCLQPSPPAGSNRPCVVRPSHASCHGALTVKGPLRW